MRRLSKMFLRCLEGRESSLRRFSVHRSTRPNPTEMNRLEKTTRGIPPMAPPSVKMSRKTRMPEVMPETLVLPPARKFVIERDRVPPAGSAPNREFAIFPMPCPRSSRLLLCRVPIMLSETMALNRDSIEPIKPSAKPVARTWGRKAGRSASLTIRMNSRGVSGFGHLKLMSPMTGPSVPMPAADLRR